jgi:hypothetical protein
MEETRARKVWEEGGKDSRIVVVRYTENFVPLVTSYPKGEWGSRKAKVGLDIIATFHIVTCPLRKIH